MDMDGVAVGITACFSSRARMELDGVVRFDDKLSFAEMAVYGQKVGWLDSV